MAAKEMITMLGANAFLLAVVFFLIRKYINDMSTALTERISGNLKFVESKFEAVEKTVSSKVDSMREHCGTVSGNMNKNLTAISDDQKNMWDAFNKHGHKGLDGNGSKVTR